VLSGIAGVAKPDPAAFLLVAQRLGVAPQRCVFVDDLRRNVLGAVSAGMTGVHHTSLDATLHELGVLIFAV
jgi:HAD superfamily hydrolase (TIGR01509 family)